MSGDSKTFVQRFRRWKHDCESCEFKGAWEEYDVYACGSGTHTLGESLIARYGDDGPEYSSFPKSVFADAVKETVLGRVGDGQGHVIPDAKLPRWMEAVMRVLFFESAGD